MIHDALNTTICTNTCTAQARRERDKRGKSFPGPRDIWGPTLLKNTEKGVPCGFFLTSNMHKSTLGRGSASDPAGGAYGAPPDP